MIQAQPIRSVLLAVDLSAAPDALIRDAALFAGSLGAELHVIHALDRGPLGAETETWLDLQKRLHERRIQLHGLMESAVPRGTAVRSAGVALGAPGDVIPARAADRGADLIVLGQHRCRAFGDRYLGSTAERVARSAAVPCLLLNSPVHCPVRRILVPADFSARSRGALRRGMSWVRALSGRGPVSIDVVHVVSSGSTLRRSGDASADIKAELERQIDEARRSARVNVDITAHVLYGQDPSSELLLYAGEIGADLVVMGTRGDSPVVRGLLGSVSSELLRRSLTPLLLVPPLAMAADLREAEMEPAGWVPFPLVH